MSRRRRRIRNRRRRRPPNRWLILAQIGLLVGALVFLYAFGDQIAAGASNLVSALTHSSPAASVDAEDSERERTLNPPSQPASTTDTAPRSGDAGR